MNSLCGSQMLLLHDTPNVGKQHETEYCLDVFQATSGAQVESVWAVCSNTANFYLYLVFYICNVVNKLWSFCIGMSVPEHKKLSYRRKSFKLHLKYRNWYSGLESQVFTSEKSVTSLKISFLTFSLIWTGIAKKKKKSDFGLSHCYVR
jgi:hypothetical protein